MQMTLAPSPLEGEGRGEGVLNNSGVHSPSRIVTRRCRITPCSSAL